MYHYYFTLASLLCFQYILGAIRAARSVLSRLSGPWYASLTTLTPQLCTPKFHGTVLVRGYLEKCELSRVEDDFQTSISNMIIQLHQSTRTSQALQAIPIAGISRVLC